MGQGVCPSNDNAPCREGFRCMSSGGCCLDYYEMTAGFENSDASAFPSAYILLAPTCPGLPLLCPYLPLLAPPCRPYLPLLAPACPYFAPTCPYLPLLVAPTCP